MLLTPPSALGALRARGGMSGCCIDCQKRVLAALQLGQRIIGEPRHTARHHRFAVPQQEAPHSIASACCRMERCGDAIEAQAEACWRNIIAILADAGMGIDDLVKITTYLVRPEDVAAAGAARAKHFGDARPGSATIIVKALVNPSFLIEIEAVAAARAR